MSIPSPLICLNNRRDEDTGAYSALIQFLKPDSWKNDVFVRFFAIDSINRLYDHLTMIKISEVGYVALHKLSIEEIRNFILVYKYLQTEGIIPLYES